MMTMMMMTMMTMMMMMMMMLTHHHHHRHRHHTPYRIDAHVRDDRAIVRARTVATSTHSIARGFVALYVASNDLDVASTPRSRRLVRHPRIVRRAT